MVGKATEAGKRCLTRHWSIRDSPFKVRKPGNAPRTQVFPRYGRDGSIVRFDATLGIWSLSSGLTSIRLGGLRLNWLGRPFKPAAHLWVQ